MGEYVVVQLCGTPKKARQEFESDINCLSTHMGFKVSAAFNKNCARYDHWHSDNDGVVHTMYLCPHQIEQIKGMDVHQIHSIGPDTGKQYQEAWEYLQFRASIPKKENTDVNQQDAIEI